MSGYIKMSAGAEEFHLSKIFESFIDERRNDGKIAPKTYSINLCGSRLAMACLFMLRKQIVPCIFMLGAILLNFRNREFNLSSSVSLQQGKEHNVALIVDGKPIMENVSSFWIERSYFWGRGEKEIQVTKKDTCFIVDLISHDYFFGQDAVKRIKEEQLSNDKSIDYYLLMNKREHYTIREEFLQNLRRFSQSSR